MASVIDGLSADMPAITSGPAGTALRRALFCAMAVGLVSCSSATSVGSPSHSTPPPDPSSSSGVFGSASPWGLAGFALCPSAFASSNVNEIRGGSAAFMVPGMPAAVTICAYGLRTTPQDIGRLGRSVTLGNTEAGDLAARLNVLPPAPSGTVSCGSDDGTIYLLIFTYPISAEVIDIAVEPTGCLFVTNGPRTAVVDEFTSQAIADYVDGDIA